MYEATKLLSSSSLPTQGDLRLTFLGMLASLKHHKQQSHQHHNIVDAIYNKLEIYWNRHLSDSSSVSAILDPRYKITTFNNLVERNEYIDHLKSLFALYITNSHIISNKTSEKTLQNPRNYFLNMINHQVYSPVENLEFDEIDNYLNTSNDINTDPLLWWKEHQSEYPTLSLIAKDYLIIQATSVAAEQAFSVAGNAITQTRNKLDPESARAILCLKSWIENEMGINNLYIYNETSDDDYSDSSYNYSSSDTDSNYNNSSDTDSNYNNRSNTDSD